MTVTRRIRSPGRARNKPLKPLRAGMPGDPGCTCGDYARVLTSPFAREAMGATRTRHSPRPLFSKGECFMHNSGASRRGNAEACRQTMRLFEKLRWQFVEVRARHTMRRPCERRDP